MLPRLNNFGIICRSRKVAFSLMSWMNQFWNKLLEPKRIFYTQYLQWTSLVQTVQAEKWHPPLSREWISFETNCRSQNVSFTHITSTKQLFYKLEEQKRGILPDVVNESILKQTVGAKTFILLMVPRLNNFGTICSEQNSGILPHLVNESILKPTVGAKTFILPTIPRMNKCGTNCRSRKVANSLILWKNQFWNKL